MVFLYIFSGLLVLYIVAQYNGLIRSKNRIEYALGGIDAILQKRYELIPNLVVCVKGYMKHEQATLESIVELRNKGNENTLALNDQSDQIIRSIFITAENYPDLKADSTFMHLQYALSEVEEQLSAARRTYNAHALYFNNKIENIPGYFFAAILNYKRVAMIQILENQKSIPNMNDLLKNND